MTDEAWGQLMDLSITCGMNQRYWQAVESLQVSAPISMVLLGFVVVFGIAAILVGVLSFAPRLTRAIWVCVGATVTGASVVWLTYAIPPDGDAKLFRAEWTQLRLDVDDALIDEDVSRYKEFVHRKNLISSREPEPRRSLLVSCLEDEERSRGSRP